MLAVVLDALKETEQLDVTLGPQGGQPPLTQPMALDRHGWPRTPHEQRWPPSPRPRKAVNRRSDERRTKLLGEKPPEGVLKQLIPQTTSVSHFDDATHPAKSEEVYVSDQDSVYRVGMKPDHWAAL
jgi:hypothetical protein